MQKYKIVASKSQKKYTLILSADSESHAKEKLHKDGYSVLTIQEVNGSDIQGKKFLFQIEKNGEIKNGIIIGEDIFKVYVKLTSELGYHLISLYPEGDDAQSDAAKRQKIMDDLKKGLEIQNKKIKVKKETEKAEESFYLQKKIEQTSLIIERAIKKIENILENKKKFDIDDELYFKLQNIYEKILHIKGSTNIAKLQEIGEIALVKIAKIELKSLEKKKDVDSKKLLLETNMLLKKIGSSEHFVEKNKDIKLIIYNFLDSFKKKFSSENKRKQINKKEKNIDTDSYSFLKTILLLEKYREKLSHNNKEIIKNFLLFLNLFSKSEKKEKILLKRKVIKQNISLLRVKKTGAVGSYTGIKKGFQKTWHFFASYTQSIGNQFFSFFLFFYFLFFLFFLGKNIGIIDISFNIRSFLYVILLQIFYITIIYNRGFLAFFINIVFLAFFYIFMGINF